MKSSKLSQAFIYLILSVFALIFLFPFYWMAISSFKSRADLFAFPPELVPYHPTFENFINLLTKTNYARNFINSIVVALIFTVLSVFLCALCGYAFAKMRFHGRDFLFAIVIATMSLPFEITLVPLFKLMTVLHWNNTYFAVIIPFAATAWGVFLMRQSMLDIPEDLLDAARIDGANEFRIFWTVVISVSAPAMGALAILQFLDSWNMFIWPLIVLTEDKMMTVPVALAAFRSSFYADYASITAGSFLATVPIVIVFLALQKYFIRGALFGSVKG